MADSTKNEILVAMMAAEIEKALGHLNAARNFAGVVRYNLTLEKIDKAIDFVEDIERW